MGLGLGLLYFTSITTIFQPYRDGQVHDGGNRSTRRQTLAHTSNVVSSTHRLCRIQTHNVFGDRR